MSISQCHGPHRDPPTRRQPACGTSIASCRHASGVTLRGVHSQAKWPQAPLDVPEGRLSSFPLAPPTLKSREFRHSTRVATSPHESNTWNQVKSLTHSIAYTCNSPTTRKLRATAEFRSVTLRALSATVPIPLKCPGVAQHERDVPSRNFVAALPPGMSRAVKQRPIGKCQRLSLHHKGQLCPYRNFRCAWIT